MSREQIKEEFLKSYNCTSLEQFKKKMLTSDKFYEIIDDYLTKCTYNQKFQDEQKEFIEYLENEIKNSDICDVYVRGMKFNSAEKMIYKDILSKYKETIGGLDE